MKIKFTLAILALCAGSAHAAMDCSASPQTILAEYDRYTFWPTCGYWVEVPFEVSILPTPPEIEVPTPPVPEPSAWLLMLAGGAGVGFVVRRRKH